MTCHDARERFSDLVDGRLDAADRAAVDAHLAGCAACRAELDAFRGTIALVRSLGPVRAPEGFAARVVAAAERPALVRPARRRLVDRLIFPLPVKLPLEAAALLLVGVGVAYLFQHTPELQQAAQVDKAVVIERKESVEPAPAPAAPAAPATTPGPSEQRAVAEPQTKKREAVAAPDVGVQAKDAPGAKSDLATAPAPQPVTPPAAPPAASAPAPAPMPAPAPAPPVVAQQQQRDFQLRQSPPGIGATAPPIVMREAPQQRQDAPVQRPEPPTPPQRVLRDAPRAKEEPRAGLVQETGKLSHRAIAKTTAAPDVAGVLAVASRPDAIAALRELVVRTRGQVLDSQADASGHTVELRIPRAELAAFLVGLEGLGRWRVDRSPTDVPDDVRVTIRLVP